MSWYEEAAREIGDNATEWCAKYDVEAAAAIIAKHDPNRWVPVSEVPPIFIRIHGFWNMGAIKTVVDVIFDGERFWRDEFNGIELTITHWRPIVLPEVKG